MNLSAAVSISGASILETKAGDYLDRTGAYLIVRLRLTVAKLTLSKPVPAGFKPLITRSSIDELNRKYCVPRLPSSRSSATRMGPVSRAISKLDRT